MKSLRIDLRVGESMTIEDGRITVTLEEKSGQRARLRIEAPADVDVHRINPTINVRTRGLTMK
jgi:sRNA-binding carbon storage regulator CsrA